ncbi:hypothetical protein AVEN_162267-1 [Araneus ventricosus]|uniref:Uncharacterized protein n=1 Tax=Araneus ventricosus TaxID=182803 RepID=A0A4Y2M618_ARAVE|nr:hypothetical protein AVEN_162267-1 [Araneus ventricosus]
MRASIGEWWQSMASTVRTAANNWCKSFREGRQTISDLPRPDQANIVITNDSIAAVDEVTRANRRVRIRDISDELNLSKGTVNTIVHQHLGVYSGTPGWVG